MGAIFACWWAHEEATEGTRCLLQISGERISGPRTRKYSRASHCQRVIQQEKLLAIGQQWPSAAPSQIPLTKKLLRSSQSRGDFVWFLSKALTRNQETVLPYHQHHSDRSVAVNERAVHNQRDGAVDWIWAGPMLEHLFAHT